MNLVRLIYTSEASGEIDDIQLKELQMQAIRRNEESDITGLLMFGNARFIQLLEGPQQNVDDTYCRILDDDRHFKIHLLYYEPAAERLFPSWSMGIANLSNDRIDADIKRLWGEIENQNAWLEDDHTLFYALFEEFSSLGPATA